MKKCRKCGAENLNDQQDHCPKCGVIYVKYEQQLAEIRRRERLGIAFEKEIELGSEINAEFEDEENEKDVRAYGVVDFLIWSIVALAVLVGAIEFKLLWAVWDSLDAWVKFPADSKAAFWLSLAVVEGLTFCCTIAIAGMLYLCRDIANNTRASRAYLRKLARRK